MARVFSGIQPSGDLHIGNYLGAVKHWVDLQRQHETYICIVDYHAITLEYDVTRFRQRTRDMAVGLMAAGIDPNQSVFFVQSHVQEHTELGWIFNTVTPIGDLERMTAFKDKSQRQESVLAGLLNYPVLQAADVLLYRADLVPVGEDQQQHVELMREIARKWNARYGELFPEPLAQIGTAGRIKGLDGKAKMSKSLNNTVGILEEPDAIWATVKTGITDPARVRKTDPGTPGICNIYALHGHVSPPDTVTEVANNCRNAGWGCMDCKRVLADNIASTFAPMRDRARVFDATPGAVDDTLAGGAEKARAVARETMRNVREHMGFLPPAGGANRS